MSVQQISTLQQPPSNPPTWFRLARQRGRIDFLPPAKCFAVGPLDAKMNLSLLPMQVSFLNQISAESWRLPFGDRPKKKRG